MENVVYHGSPIGNLEEIEKRVGTHGIAVIYATYIKAVALTYMYRDGNKDYDTKLNISAKEFSMVERRPGVLKELYDRGGYLYELPGDSFFGKDEALKKLGKEIWGAEVISLEDNIKPLKCTYYPNILKALEEEEAKGNIKIYRYPNRPQGMPLDNSDLLTDKKIGKWINHYRKNGTHKGNKDLELCLKIYPELAEKVEEEFMQYGVSFMHSIELRSLQEQLKKKEAFNVFFGSENYGLGFNIRKNSIPNVDFDTVVFIPRGVRNDKEKDISLVIPSDIQASINTRDNGRENATRAFSHRLVSRIKETKEIPDSIMIYTIIPNLSELKKDEQVNELESSQLTISNELAKKVINVVTFVRNELKSYGIATNEKVNVDIANTDDIFKCKQNVEI